jgi:hypothetical protein
MKVPWLVYRVSRMYFQMTNMAGLRIMICLRRLVRRQLRISFEECVIWSCETVCFTKGNIPYTSEPWLDTEMETLTTNSLTAAKSNHN